MMVIGTISDLNVSTWTTRGQRLRVLSAGEGPRILWWTSPGIWQTPSAESWARR
jgi:hypothetical protein